MNKKHFIALADHIRKHNREYQGSRSVFSSEHIVSLSYFLAKQNPGFNRERWLDYIDGLCGPNGGALKS